MGREGSRMLPNPTGVAGNSVASPADGREASSLDFQDVTRRAPGRYRFSAWPETGEAAVVWLPYGRSAGTEPRTAEGVEDDRAERRARAVIRRYCVRNDLRRLWTLTCADQITDVTAMHRRVRRFLRLLRIEFGVMPYVVVLERHRSGALHAHLALPARFLAHGQVARVWGHGFVHYRDRGVRLQGRRSEARVLASYLAKYVAKDPVREGFGAHRYEVAEGFQPRVIRRSFGSLGAAVQKVMERFVLIQGEALDLAWDSTSSPTWRGPPVRYFRFNEGVAA